MKFKPGDINWIDELPRGDWSVSSFEGTLIFVSPQHAPRILKDGKLTRLHLIDLEPDDDFYYEFDDAYCLH